jgi:hypothetical protein
MTGFVLNVVAHCYAELYRLVKRDGIEHVPRRLHTEYVMQLQPSADRESPLDLVFLISLEL